MCAINPKREQHFTLSAYTSIDMTQGQFIEIILEKVLEMESKLNEDARLRWHIKEKE